MTVLNGVNQITKVSMNTSVCWGGRGGGRQNHNFTCLSSSGKEETPVFALPLLLAMDTWVEPLFQALLHWEFKCSECGAATNERR